MDQETVSTAKVQVLLKKLRDHTMNSFERTSSDLLSVGIESARNGLPWLDIIRRTFQNGSVFIEFNTENTTIPAVVIKKTGKEFQYTLEVLVTFGDDSDERYTYSLQDKEDTMLMSTKLSELFHEYDGLTPTITFVSE